MLDREIVAAIVAGDPAGLEAAYDRYAPSLYAYCQSLLAERADAADAVQDTFIIAAGKLAALRDPDRLRPWLYAVARNECRRRLRSAGSAPLDEAAGVTDDTTDLGAGLEQAELREVVWSALAGLTPSEREIIELSLGHELDGADLADALGVPRNQAHAMASRARAHFEAALGVLLVARAGREACAELAGILDSWDGRLTVLLRKRVGRHIRRCAVCGDRQRQELSPVALFSVLPMAALPVALRHQVLGLITDGSPGAAAQRLAVGQRAGPLGPGGFPRPLDPPSPVGLHHLTHSTVARGGAAVGGAAIVGGALIGGGGAAPPRRPRPPRGVVPGGFARCGRRRRGGPLAGPGGAAHRAGRRQHRPGRAGRRPGPAGVHLRGSVARAIGGGRGHPDRVTGQPGPQVVPQRAVERHDDPHRSGRPGVRLPRHGARPPAAGPDAQPGVRVTGGRPERSHPGDRRGRGPVLHRAADRESRRPQRPGHLPPARLAACADPG